MLGDVIAQKRSEVLRHQGLKVQTYQTSLCNAASTSLGIFTGAKHVAVSEEHPGRARGSAFLFCEVSS
jgi:hypothetical protein